jgi:signal transduction histidine kinase
VAGTSWSLRTRLVLGVSLVVAVVLVVESLLEIRLFEQAADRDLRETGLVTAEAVVDDFELRPGPLVESELNSGLHEFARSVPAIRAISIVRLEEGRPVVIASTITREADAALALARNTLLHGEQGWHDDGPVTRLALRTAPTTGGPAAVVVTLAMASMAQLRTRGRLVSLWLVPIAIVVLTLLLDQVLRRLVYRPIAALQETMTRTGGGDLSARAPVARMDEMGAVAAGLNRMLDRLADFNRALEERIFAVTGELDRAHAERIQDYQRMLELREALAEAERLAAVGQTTASVAHQVGTPLNLISGHVQVLLAKPDLPLDVTRRLHLVQEQINRVTDAVRSLLEHTRRPGPRSAIAPRALLDSIADLIRPRLLACGVRLHQDVDEGLPAVRGDRDELEMALLNLVSNAIDAMPSGGDLHLAASLAEGAVRITVQDTGLGIAPDLLPRIFEPFVTTKAPGRGTGLGLSITRDVIARLGGVILAEPAPDGGTVFVITLPAGQADASNVDSAHR